MSMLEMDKLLKPLEAQEELPDIETQRKVLEALRRHQNEEKLRLERERLGVSEDNVLFEFADIAPEVYSHPDTQVVDDEDESDIPISSLSGEEFVEQWHAHDTEKDNERFANIIKNAGRIAGSGNLTNTDY